VTRWVVDGLNVIGSRPTGWWRDRPGAMRELVGALRSFALSGGESVIVVFDGRPFEIEAGDGVEVTFASRPGRGAADDAIAELVRQAADPRGLRVVTSDSELAERVRAHGAEVVPAGRFRARLDEPASEGPSRLDEPAPDHAYAVAFRDWLACAVGGRDEPAARAARELRDPVVAAGAAGHVLDFDDTYLPGIAHLSAPTAPAALVLGAELGRTTGEVLDAYAAGFEAMGAFARAAHPALYDRGLHPTATCGSVGAAVVAARLLDLDAERSRSAVAIALLGAGGLRAGFGSDGKALQVGLAAAAGLRAARLSEAGARVPLDVAAQGFERTTGGRFVEADPNERAIDRNWIKAWPCCLMAHGAIEAADRARARSALPARVVVHPVALQAAAVGPFPEDGLQAKFSIPYLTAYTLLHGPPGLESFDEIDAEARDLAATIEVRAESALLESEAILTSNGEEIAHVEAALGSPERPLGPSELRTKVSALAGDRLYGVLDDRGRAARELLALTGV
jgi:2-methylcitrate dehydratase PrpD/predicted RNA-binding protein with PIN domain